MKIISQQLIFTIVTFASQFNNLDFEQLLISCFHHSLQQNFVFFAAILHPNCLNIYIRGYWPSFFVFFNQIVSPGKVKVDRNHQN